MRCVRLACGASSVGVGLPSLESHATSMSGMEEMCVRDDCCSYRKLALRQRAPHPVLRGLRLVVEGNAIHLKNKTRLCVLL